MTTPTPLPELVVTFDTGNAQLDNLLEFINAEFGTILQDITQADIDRWIQDLNGTGDNNRTFAELREDILLYRVGEDAINQWFADQGITDSTLIAELMPKVLSGSDGGFAGIVEGIESGAIDPSPGTAPSGAGENIPGVLSGGTLTLISRDGQDDLWAQVYEYPAGSGQFLVWTYANIEQVEATFGADFLTATKFERRDEDFLDDLQNVQIVDSADELIGLEGSLLTMLDDAIRAGAADMGITDPTILGQYYNDPEIQRLLAQSAVLGWSETRLTGEIRNTSFYQDVLYPGIENFFGFSNPEQEWNQYVSNVVPWLKQMGVEPDADGTYRSTIGDMLDTGVDDAAFVQFAPTFINASVNTAFGDTLSQWTERAGLGAVDFDSWFDVIAGTAPLELQEIVESATLAYQAEQRDIALDPLLIEQIAQETSFSEEQAAALFSNVEASLLALGDAGLSRGRLSVEALTRASAGLSFNGESPEEIRRRAGKLATELGMADDGQVELFTGFSQTTGAPVRPGLRPLNPEGG